MIRDPESLKDVNTLCAKKTLGVTGTTLRGLEKKGIVQKLPGPRGHWDLTELIPTYIKYKIGGRVESSRAKLTEQQERKLKLANDTTEGKLIRIEYASGVFAEYAAAFRAGISALPGRCSSQLAGMSKPAEIRAVLNDEIDDLLATAERQLAGFLADKEAGSMHKSGDADTKANSKKNPRRVGGRKSNPTKRKRGARKVAK